MKVIDFAPLSITKSTTVVIDPARLQWIDITRRVDELPQLILQKLHSRHKTDLLNGTHPPFFEQSEEYELLIFRNIDQSFKITNPRTRSTAFLLLGSTVVTVHDADDATLSNIYQKWNEKNLKPPGDVLSLFHALLDEISDEFLAIHEPLVTQISEWQRRLLDPNDPFNNWQLIMLAKSSLRSLSTNLGSQRDVLSIWRENTKYVFNESKNIKFNDFDGHLARTEHLAIGISTDLDSLTQIYFASNGQKTNDNIQILAVISAIFLPLNLIAGIFGMNFENIPLLKYQWGPLIALGLMSIIAGTLLWWFKKRKWY